MRKIKTFRLFEKNDDPFFTNEEKIDLEDICQELKDLGFNIQITSGFVKISKEDSLFDEIPFCMTDDLFDVIKRIEDYLDRKYFKVNVVLAWNSPQSEEDWDTREILIDKSFQRNQNTKTPKVLFLSDTGDIPHLWSRTEIKSLSIEI